MPGVLAAVLVAAGVLLWMFVSRGLLIVAALGAFGPSLLRELGWLRDHDEFQQQAARRAGHHAYIAGGIAAMLVLSGGEWWNAAFGESSEWIRFVLVVLWLTRMSGTLLTYWGARTTTARVLRTFGSFWAVFVLAELVGEFTAGRGSGGAGSLLLGSAVGLLVIAPFFGLAWTARRWPRATGLALMVFVVVFLVVFFLRRHTSLATTVLTFTLLIGPLMICGLALLLDWGEVEEDEEAGAALNVMAPEAASSAGA
jgi:hypothetical protein